MVGVPGKSKACSNCRERRLKCDLERPQCARCTRNGRACGGYERPRIFVHRFQESGSQSPSTSVPSATSNRWTFYVPQLHDPYSLPKSPDSKIHEQKQLIARFITDFCPRLDTSLPENDRLHHYWVHVLPHIHGTVALLDQSILTLSAAFLGQNSGDAKLRKRSMVMYGNAIRDLAKVMSAASFYPNDMVLAAIQCLGMSELTWLKIYSPPSQSAVDHGWVSHMKGGAELLKARGASILATKLGKDLFIRFRGVSLWAQLVFEASILLKGEPSGQTKPFAFADPCLQSISRVASQGSHYGMLFHIMLDIPGLLQDTNLLLTPRNNAGDMAQDIILRAMTIAENLRTWLEGFAAQYPVPYACTPSETTTTGHLFPLCFHFPNLLAAQTWVHYWAAMIMLMRCIMVCQTRSPHLALPTPAFTYDYARLVYSPHLGKDLALSGPVAVALHFADNICQSAAYSCEDDKGMSGPIMLLFPLWIAKDTYANGESGACREKESHCIEVMKVLAGRGMHISDALVNLSTKDTSQTS
ncbi:hypothetical protein FBEOM_2084 [Fusarium beomiforme]|uniref:Zn(2)-C6 fungal-type domain-containing protein n=1 Tax=Fusarium beomiforme TaxID=44412 RepID=A0A9P5E0C1_9HYPO|nr:hypothetical protein FBEOM_2084 [Fusarium beomiforme]